MIPFSLITLKASHKTSYTNMGEGRVIWTPTSFDAIPPIDMIFATYNELPFYFQLNVTMLCLTGFHGNHSYINEVTSGRHLGFLSFQILSRFEL